MMTTIYDEDPEWLKQLKLGQKANDAHPNQLALPAVVKVREPAESHPDVVAMPNLFGRTRKVPLSALATPILHPPLWGEQAEGPYRFYLWRILNEDKSPLERRRLLWVMYNPSTANDVRNDPTARRVVGFTRALGYHLADVVNLFAWRDKDPKVIAKMLRDIGSSARPTTLVGVAGGTRADLTIERAARAATTIVVAWGALKHEKEIERARQVRGMLPADVFCLGTTKSGDPKHPLYLKNSTPLEPWLGRKEK